MNAGLDIFYVTSPGTTALCYMAPGNGYRRWLDPAVEDTVRSMLAQGQHDQAATALIRGYGRRILGYLRAVLRDEALTGDAFSVFGENAWRGIAGFRGDSSAL